MTRVEILTVGLIIGVVGAASAFAVSMARERTRDVTRLAQVREIQVGLELFFNDHAAYPVTAEPLALGRTTTACLTGSGFGAPCASGDTSSAYVEFVPATPSQGLKGKSSCAGVKDAYCYFGNGTAFTVQFELERSNNLLELKKGLNCATPAGFKAGACPTLVPAVQ